MRNSASSIIVREPRHSGGFLFIVVDPRPQPYSTELFHLSIFSVNTLKLQKRGKKSLAKEKKKKILIPVDYFSHPLPSK